jgi:hypothetical protein
MVKVDKDGDGGKARDGCKVVMAVVEARER